MKIPKLQESIEKRVSTGCVPHFAIGLGFAPAQVHGNADRSKYKGHFMRSGKTAQYLAELEQETITTVQNYLLEQGVPEWVFLSE